MINHLISVKPMAVTKRVEGTPNLRWLQKDKVYARYGDWRACSHTIKLAADPNSDRFPATVLTQAKRSQAFFSSAAEIAAADAATRAPSNRTSQQEERKEEEKKTCKVAAPVLRSLAVGVLQIDIRIVKINTATYQLVHLKPNLIAQVWLGQEQLSQ